jgi:hypothetical protein
VLTVVLDSLGVPVHAVLACGRKRWSRDSSGSAGRG